LYLKAVDHVFFLRRLLGPEPVELLHFSRGQPQGVVEALRE
jgi:hypothetical protein